MTVFGPIVPATVVRKRALVTLQTWVESYLAEYQRQDAWEGPDIAVPKSWGIPTGRFDKWPEAMTPHVAVMSTGTNGNTRIHEDGVYTVPWGFEVTAIVSANSPEATLVLSEVYAACIASCLVEQPFGAPVQEVRWDGADDEPVTSDTDRTMVAVTLRFTAFVENVARRGAGPREVPVPPSDPAPDDPVVETVHLVGVRTPVTD